MRSFFIVLTTLWAGVLSAAAQPPQYIGSYRIGFATTTQISGTDGTARVQLPRPAFVQAEVPSQKTVYGNRNHELGVMEFFERSDEPCSVSVFTGWGYDTYEEEHVWDGCEGRRRSRQVISGLMYLGDEYEDAQRYSYLKGVRVCQSTRTDERRDIVKGVDAQWVTHPSAREIWHTREERTSFERPNCNGNWAPWAWCPDGTAALAVRLHHKALGGRRALTGVSLRCHIMEARLYDFDERRIADRYVAYEVPNVLDPQKASEGKDGGFNPLFPGGH